MRATPHLLSITLWALALTSCLEQERWLFEALPTDAPDSPDLDSRDASCSPMLCSPDQCGVFPNGCGGVVDCGPCSSVRCPATFTPLFGDVLTPELMAVTPDDALLYLSKNGSNPISEWPILGERGPVDLIDGVAIRRLVATQDYIFATTWSGLLRLRRLGRPSELPRRTDLSPSFEWNTIAALASHGERVWMTTRQPPTIWRVDEAQAALVAAATPEAVPAYELLAVTAQHVTWAAQDAQGAWLLEQLTLVDGAPAPPAPPSRRWAAQPGEQITHLLAMADGELILLTQRDQGAQAQASLWRWAPQAPEPTLVRQWGGVEWLGLAALDAGRVALARTARGRFQDGWMVTTLELDRAREQVIFSVSAGSTLTPARRPLVSDGRCVFIAYQYTFSVQRQSMGDIGWVRAESPP